MKRLFAALIAGLFLAGSALADLSVSQMQALKTAALADPIAAGYLMAGNDNELAQWFNAPGVKVVWRAQLTPDIMDPAIVAGAVQLDNLTVGKRDTLLWLANRELDNSAALRTALDDLCGTQNTLKTAIKDAQKRASTRAESALSAGTGTSVDPATLGWEGQIDSDIAAQIRVQ